MNPRNLVRATLALIVHPVTRAAYEAGFNEGRAQGMKLARIPDMDKARTSGTKGGRS